MSVHRFGITIEFGPLLPWQVARVLLSSHGHCRMVVTGSRSYNSSIERALMIRGAPLGPMKQTVIELPSQSCTLQVK